MKQYSHDENSMATSSESIPLILENKDTNRFFVYSYPYSSLHSRHLYAQFHAAFFTVDRVEAPKCSLTDEPNRRWNHVHTIL